MNYKYLGKQLKIYFFSAFSTMLKYNIRINNVLLKEQKKLFKEISNFLIELEICFIRLFQ